MSRGSKGDGILKHQVHSPTAASAGNPLYGPSGAMLYRVRVASGMGFMDHDVDAVSGDKAAEAALVKYPGCKVAHVAPASDPIWGQAAVPQQPETLAA